MSTTPTPAAPPRLTLRALPLSARLTLTAFLISVGLGYLAALTQLHFQHASAGSLLPTVDDAARVYHGNTAKDGKPKSKIEILLEADESLKFNGSGQMRTAFTTNSSGWKSELKRRTKSAEGNAEKAEKELRTERDGERQAILAWIRAGASKEAYEKDSFALPAGQEKLTVTEDFVEAGPPRTVKIKTILDERCKRCHEENAEAEKYPLTKFEQIEPYTKVEEKADAGSGGMSLNKLAQTTHVHLLGFSVLYGFTGLIFAFSSYPGPLRAVLSPLPLVAQVLEISCWWLARLDPVFAQVIVIGGGIVALGLLLHIVLSIFDMYGVIGKSLWGLVLLAAMGGGFFAKTQYLDPFLAKEKAPAAAAPDKH